MTHWIIREWMNAVTLVLFLCLAVQFYRVRVTSPVKAPRREAATALCVLSIGEAMRSGWAWLALASQNKDWAIFGAVQGSWLAGVVAAGTILIGAVCCLRVFSGAHRSGFAAIALAAIFLSITMLL